MPTPPVGGLIWDPFSGKEKYGQMYGGRYMPLFDAVSLKWLFFPRCLSWNVWMIAIAVIQTSQLKNELFHDVQGLYSSWGAAGSPRLLSKLPGSFARPMRQRLAHWLPSNHFAWPRELRDFQSTLRQESWELPCWALFAPKNIKNFPTFMDTEGVLHPETGINVAHLFCAYWESIRIISRDLLSTRSTQVPELLLQHPPSLQSCRGIGRCQNKALAYTCISTWCLTFS